MSELVKNSDYLGEARDRLTEQFKFAPQQHGPILQVGTGSGQIAITGTPNTTKAYHISVVITVSGQAAACTWHYVVNGVAAAGFVGTSQVIGTTGLTITLVDGGANPSFIALDTYSFFSPWLGRIDGFLQAWMQEVQAVENAMFDVFSFRELTKHHFPAGGRDDILTKLGLIVGQPRENFTNKPYGSMITARIATNRSDARRETLIHIMNLLTATTTFPVLFYEFVGNIILEPTAPVGVIPANVVFYEFLILAVAAGVRLDFVYSVVSSATTFTFSDSGGGFPGPDTQGFGDSVAGGVGGRLTGVFGQIGGAA